MKREPSIKITKYAKRLHPRNLMKAKKAANHLKMVQLMLNHAKTGFSDTYLSIFGGMIVWSIGDKQMDYKQLVQHEARVKNYLREVMG